MDTFLSLDNVYLSGILGKSLEQNEWDVDFVAKVYCSIRVDLIVGSTLVCSGTVLCTVDLMK